MAVVIAGDRGQRTAVALIKSTHIELINPGLEVILQFKRESAGICCILHDNVSPGMGFGIVAPQDHKGIGAATAIPGEVVGSPSARDSDPAGNVMLG